MSNPDYDVLHSPSVAGKRAAVVRAYKERKMSAAEFSRLLTKKPRKKKRKKVTRKKARRRKATTASHRKRRRKVGARKKRRTTRTYGRGKKCKRRKVATCKRLRSAGKRMSKGKTASARSRAAKVVSCSRVRKKRCRKKHTIMG